MRFSDGRTCICRAFVSLILLTSTVGAVLFTNPEQLPTTTYDFVIVGGGAAGNVVATRLTEDPGCSVLVIEAGPSNVGIIPVEVPFLAPSLDPFSSVTWNYTTVPQSHLHGRNVSFTRGRVLGGSSSINYMTYTRGSDEEYDRWAALTGDKSWEWKNVERYYLKNSRLVPPADNHSTPGIVNPAVHGDGPIEISLPGVATEIDSRVIDTSKSSGSDFPFNVDMNSGNPLGVGVIQSTIGNGTRSSSATAYLEPVLHRANLHVIVQHTATKLITEGTKHGIPVFSKVEFAAFAKTARTTVTARNEIILSAGAVATPQLLMLSGIGDPKSLKRHGIGTIVRLPDVGKHLQDQPIMSNYWMVNSNKTQDDLLRSPSLLSADLTQWMKTKTNLFGNPPTTTLAFLRLPDNASVFEDFSDPSAGPTSPHFEMLFADKFTVSPLPLPATGHFFTISTAVISPVSKGTIELASSDPFTFPIIDPHFFESSFDRFTMLSAVKAARKFVEAAPWKDFIVSRFGPVGSAETDEEIIAAARESVDSIWHPTSTARMSPKHARWGVVDPQLLVKGAHGLRIVDASVFPAIPAAHTVAPTYILAERASDIIKAAWGLQ